MSLEILGASVVCVEAEIRGNVKIGSRTVVHPYAKILATAGPIVIGDSNIIEEFATIENLSSDTLHIGNFNVFEVKCTVSAKSIGDYNLFETGCKVGTKIEVGTGCSFGAGTEVKINGPIQDNSVFFGRPVNHRIATDRPQLQNLQIDFLSRVLPNYHNIKKGIERKIPS